MKRFPLYKNDGIASVPLTEGQLVNVKKVSDKIRSGEYSLVSVSCLCGEKTAESVTISEKDRYGFAINSDICMRCGLIRSAKIFDEKSNISFYSDEYRNIYEPPGVTIDSFFADQHNRGIAFLNLFEQKAGQHKGCHVFEIGCGAGGILAPFMEAGYHCSGCDYNDRYLNFGRSRGLDLHLGDYHDILSDSSIDIIILSHVLEHLVDPVKELNDIFEKLKPEGYLILEVPGVFHIKKGYFSPITYFQNAHVYSFYMDYIVQIAQQLKLQIIFGDERCTFILQKPQGWIRNDHIVINGSELKGQADRILAYIYLNYIIHKFKLNYYYWRYVFFTTLRRLKIIK